MKNYIFDLDNTLYPYDNGLFDMQLQRMSDFIKLKLDILDDEKASAIRDELYYECGSTMLGLMRYHNIEYKEFLHFIDNIEINHFRPNKELNGILLDLKEKNKNLYIFTNASDFHADRVLKQFDLHQFFHGILTLEKTGLVPKPKQKYYEIGQQKFGLNFEDSVFFEDSSHNLVTAKHLGMTTVLVHADNEKSAANFYDNAEIDYYVRDVKSFFKSDYIATRK
ncbi:pyrimidine 5'-nucleotidase [Francisella frigiditurris]|uniref:HAD hydrolase, IA, variant 3 family protein n=1 Tax=Francisella frigiditurris TaxID=1542390 RepID=A0A1J0KTP5_9GAMM|nr:pyrimidine 5'-nucleotidase [Francisella frigiditurris]APC97059.1 HAD hydrolase, IA, variant 3 family protein [Francisella frigiditurris]